MNKANLCLVCRMPIYADRKYKHYVIVYVLKTPYLCSRKHLVT